MVNYQEVGPCFEAHSPSDLNGVAAQIIKEAGDHTIWLLEGEMGAGKTSLIQALCKQLEVHGVVTSPTYTLVNEYESAQGQVIYHFDFYRIKSLEEAMDIGTQEYFYSGNLCLIEWGNKVASLIPEKHLKINIAASTEGMRKFVIEHYH